MTREYRRALRTAGAAVAALVRAKRIANSTNQPGSQEPHAEQMAPVNPSGVEDERNKETDAAE